MTIGKWALALLMVLLAGACMEQKAGQPGPVADTPENRKAAAQRYMEAMPTQELLKSIAGNMVRRLPEPTRKPFLEAMTDPELDKATQTITMDGLVKHFTAGELNAMATFYGSPEGKSARTKFGPYMAEVMPLINDEVRKVFVKVQGQLKEEPPQAGKPAAPGAPAAPSAPKAEQPKAEPPKAAPPKAEQPKAAPPKVEQPKAEQPKAAPPKPEPPKAEQPKAEPPKGK